MTSTFKLVLYTKTKLPALRRSERGSPASPAGDPLFLEERDIEQDPAAWEAYHMLIPVVELDGEAIFYGKVSAHRLRQILRAKEAGAPALTPRYKAFLRRLRDMLAKP